MNQETDYLSKFEDHKWSFFKHLQGLPSGFDLMYLALADRNIQVRFGLKVVGES